MLKCSFNKVFNCYLTNYSSKRKNQRNLNPYNSFLYSGFITGMFFPIRYDTIRNVTDIEDFLIARNYIIESILQNIPPQIMVEDYIKQNTYRAFDYNDIFSIFNYEFNQDPETYRSYMDQYRDFFIQHGYHFHQNPFPELPIFLAQNQDKIDLITHLVYENKQNLIDLIAPHVISGLTIGVNLAAIEAMKKLRATIASTATESIASTATESIASTVTESIASTVIQSVTTDISSNLLPNSMNQLVPVGASGSPFDKGWSFLSDNAAYFVGGAVAAGVVVYVIWKYFRPRDPEDPEGSSIGGISPSNSSSSQNAIPSSKFIVKFTLVLVISITILYNPLLVFI